MEQLQKGYAVPRNGNFELRTGNGDTLLLECNNGAFTISPTTGDWQIGKTEGVGAARAGGAGHGG